MGEMDTDTIGLIILIAAVLAVIVAGKRQARKAKADAAPRSRGDAVVRRLGTLESSSVVGLRSPNWLSPLET